VEVVGGDEPCASARSPNDVTAREVDVQVDVRREYTPISVAATKRWNGTPTMGDATLTNQFGMSGVMRRNNR
jgi:hypothetical protein